MWVSHWKRLKWYWRQQKLPHTGALQPGGAVIAARLRSQFLEGRHDSFVRDRLILRQPAPHLYWE